MSLFPSTQTIQVITGSFVKGVYTESSTADVTFQGSVQPMTGKELESFPEARRDKGFIKAYTSTRLGAPGQDLTPVGKVIVWQGGHWEIIQELPYQSNLISHYKYVAEYQGVAT